MILSARLKVNTFDHPAHRPVNLPCELTVKVLTEIPCALMSTLTCIFTCHSVFRRGYDRCFILTTYRTVNTYRIICFSLFFCCYLLTELIKNIKNLFSLLYCLNNILRILSAAIILTLSTEINLYSKTGKRCFKFLFKMFCIRRAASIRILYIYIWLTNLVL